MMFVWLVAFTERYWYCTRSTGFQRNWLRMLFGVGLLYLAKLAQLACVRERGTSDKTIGKRPTC